MADGSSWEQVPSATIRCAEAFAVRWTGRSQGWGPGVVQIEYASGADHVWLYALTVDDGSLSHEDAVAGEICDNGGVQMTLPDLAALHQAIGSIIARLPVVCREGKGSVLTGLLPATEGEGDRA